jgi:nitrogen-specific signal transduction histidine kinase
LAIGKTMTAERNLHPARPQAGDDAKAAVQQEKLEALARFGGAMAHDLNNIVHVINSVTEVLRRRLPDAGADTTELLDMVKRNAERAGGLAADLLAFSGRQILEPVALNANRLIADMQDRLRQALGRGPLIETLLGGGLWQVHADAGELETVIVNLAQNARDAMSGQGKVTIETSNVSFDGRLPPGAAIAAGDYVAIAVRDSGIGMTEETLARAFDPYFTTKEAGPMTGLGLSRVYGFVKQTQGHIKLQSAPGAGTTVTLYLPRLRQPEVNAVPVNVVPLGARPVHGHAARTLAGLRVLVVEDESLIGMLAEDLLEQLGCRMIGLVSSLGKALEMAKSPDIDFALLDVDIGGEPVYPVALALQARNVPFAFMSGYGGLDGPWRGRPMIQKPFDLMQLRTEIERALST